MQKCIRKIWDSFLSSIKNSICSCQLHSKDCRLLYKYERSIHGCNRTKRNWVYFQFDLHKSDYYVWDAACIYWRTKSKEQEMYIGHAARKICWERNAMRIREGHGKEMKIEFKKSIIYSIVKIKILQKKKCIVCYLNTTVPSACRSQSSNA